LTYARIRGTGSYLPERVMSNHDLERIVNTSDRWIRERTGIRGRHLAADGETCGDMATVAAHRALDAAGVAASDIDLIVVGTATPDQVFPSTACLVQHRLGVTAGAIAFDISAACSGFVFGLDIADRFIRTDGARRALIIGAETLSRVLDWSDRATCVLFGDGAGAVVVEASETPGIMSTHLHSDGGQEPLLNIPWGISQGYDTLDTQRGTIKMRGNDVFKVAVQTLGSVVDETLESNELGRGDIDWLVPHQANIRIIAATARKLAMSMDQVVVTVDRHGNTSAASIPLALDTAVRDGRITTDDVILLEAFGAGFTWGAALLRY